MRNKDIEKYRKTVTDYRIICKCGHSVVIPASMDKLLCSWCGKYVFKSDKDEFKYRLNEAMIKESKNCNNKQKVV